MCASGVSRYYERVGITILYLKDQASESPRDAQSTHEKACGRQQAGPIQVGDSRDRVTGCATSGVASSEANQKSADEQTDGSASGSHRLWQKRNGLTRKESSRDEATEGNPNDEHDRPQSRFAVVVTEVAWSTTGGAHRTHLLEAGRDAKTLTGKQVKDRHNKPDDDSG